MVRFRQAADAKSALESATAAAAGEGGFSVAGCTAEITLVEGQEEEEFYKRVSRFGCSFFFVKRKGGKENWGRGGLRWVMGLNTHIVAQDCCDPRPKLRLCCTETGCLMCLLE